TIDYLGAAVLSPTAVDELPELAAGSYDFNLLVDGTSVDISILNDTGNPANGIDTVQKLVDRINVELLGNDATASKVVAVAQEVVAGDFRLGFQILDTDIDDLAVAGSNLAALLGFPAVADALTTLENASEILRDLGSLDLAGSLAEVAVDYINGLPRVSLNIDYMTERTSEFFYNLGEQ
ncbi:unnamed protein product, partial [Discosporangium mesarthrocarpum]